MISVVIATYNGADVLGEQLSALCRQTYSGEFEVVISDNGSLDSSRSVAEEYADRLQLRFVDSSRRRGNAAARNLGAQSTVSPLLAFLDQDDEADDEWLENIALALGNADLVVGSMPMSRDWSSRYEATSPRAASTGEYGFLEFGLSSNMAIRRDAFDQLNGFDESFDSACDVDICWRAQIGGLLFAGAPAAIVRKRAKESGSFRQHFSFGVDDVRLYRRFRGTGMHRNLWLSTKRYAWIIVHAPLCFRRETRFVWTRVSGRCCGRLAECFRTGTLMP